MKFFLTIVSIMILSPKLFSQGAAAILPMSDYKIKNEPIKFTINSMIDQELTLEVTPKCESEGQEIASEKCYDYFDFSMTPPLDGNKIRIQPNGIAQGIITLKKENFKYALFKPMFTPLVEESKDKLKKGIKFNFNYQPGYLFSLSPSKERITNINMEQQVSPATDEKKMKLKLNSSILQAPQVVSVSVKVLDLGSKETIQFSRLANNKIVGTPKKDLELSLAYGKAKDTRRVCYVAYMENKLNSDVYKMSNCPGQN